MYNQHFSVLVLTELLLHLPHHHLNCFVGNDYFCDTGSTEQAYRIFYGDDPLWDGVGCGPLNDCCDLNNPPWFLKQLPFPTADDIKMRLCRSAADYEDTPVEIIEIYIK